MLTLRAVACPELCAGYLGVASLQTRVPLAMSWIRGDLWICAERAILDGAHGAEVTADRQDLTVCVGSAEPGTAGMELTPTAGSRRIEPCALGRLESLARRTYVDNTEASPPVRRRRRAGRQRLNGRPLSGGRRTPRADDVRLPGWTGPVTARGARNPVRRVRRIRRSRC